MNPVRLYIHIGTHKTGSTAIQTALHQNVAALKDEGIIFLRAPKVVKPLMIGKELDARIVSQCRESLSQDIGNHRNGGGIFLWSYEGFSGDPATGYENAPVIAESLRDITAGLEVRIIVYLRRQDDFIESLYAQTVSAGASCTFESFVENFGPSSFDWARLLHCYSERFGRENVIARRYDGTLLSGKNGLQNDFAQTVGSGSLKTCPDAHVSNRGYTRDALEIIRLANPHLNGKEKNRLHRALRQTCLKQPFESYSCWSPAKRQDILARYSESNAAVAKEYFNEPAGSLFPLPDAADSYQPFQGISDETVVVLARAIAAEPGSLLLRTALKAEKKAIALLDRVPQVKIWLKHQCRKHGLLWP